VLAGACAAEAGCWSGVARLGGRTVKRTKTLSEHPRVLIQPFSRHLNCSLCHEVKWLLGGPPPLLLSTRESAERSRDHSTNTVATSFRRARTPRSDAALHRPRTLRRGQCPAAAAKPGVPSNDLPPVHADDFIKRVLHWDCSAQPSRRANAVQGVRRPRRGAD
jgi:hypothetical protein